MATGGGAGTRVREPDWAQQLHTLYFDNGIPLRSPRRRRFVALAVVVVLVSGGLYVVASRSSSRTHRFAAATAARGAAAQELSAVPTTTLPPPTEEPGGGRSLLPQKRIVAFYGAAGVPKLGVLGEAPPDELWPRLTAQSSAYQTPGTPVVPACELIAFATEAAPGPDHSYTARISDATIDRYLRVVRAHHGLLILDIQPGRSDFLADAQSLSQWLAQPDVGLALDPEWKLDANQLPARQIGHTTADAVNAVSAWLAQLVASQNLPQKLLLIHQFTPDMVRDKPLVKLSPGLALAFNMDGYGGQAPKLSKYQQLAADTRFMLGFKVFYHQDKVPFAPADLLALTPPPNVVEYE